MATSGQCRDFLKESLLFDGAQRPRHDALLRISKGICPFIPGVRYTPDQFVRPPPQFAGYEVSQEENALQTGLPPDRNRP